MPTSRKALIVAIDSYDDVGLTRLSSATADAIALDEVLSAPDIGGFEVTICRNEPHHVVQAAIEDFFMGASPEDILLVYFSGHGLKAETGELFLAASNTRPTRLGSSAVPASFIQQCMKMSRSRGVVLFLDCCYGGAFSQGAAVRASGSADVISSFSTAATAANGRGRAVITASSSMEYAFEGARLVESEDPQPSVFAAALCQGLRTGDADRNEDGLVSLGELYEWLYDQVREANPAQTPSRQFDLQGDLYIARSTRRKVRPAPLPADLASALRDPSMFARIGALSELRHRLASPDLGIAMAALQALREIAAHDIQQVAVVAQEILDGLTLVVDPPSLTLNRTGLGAANEQVIELSGLPLARAVIPHSSAPEIWARTEGATVKVILAASPASDAASVITLNGPAGQVAVPVSIVGETAPSDTMVLVQPAAPEPAVQPPEPSVEPTGIEPTAPEPPVWTPWTAKPRVRRRRTIALAGALVLIILVGAGIARTRRGPGLQLPSSSPLPKDTMVFALPDGASPTTTDAASPTALTDEAGPTVTDLFSLQVPASTSSASGAPRQLTTDGDSAVPAISPNRRTIIYRKTSIKQASALWVMAADGSGRRPLFSANQPAALIAFGGAQGRVAWSPDGHSIAAVVQGAPATLYVIPLRTGVPVRLAQSAELGDPTWSPNGREIVFWANDGGNTHHGRLFQVGPNGKATATPFPLTEGEVEDKAPAWSPDGKELAFCRGLKFVENLLVVNADGSNPQSRTTSGGGDCYPAWSSDGKRIAFFRHTDKVIEVVANADGVQETHPLPSTTSAGQPSW